MNFFPQKLHIYLLLFSMLCCNLIVSEGFVADTLVCTPTGYAHIQDLSVGDLLMVYDSDSGNLVSEPIAHRASHEVERIMQLTIDGEIIEMSEDQLLFIPLQQCWLRASQVTTGQCLLGATLRAHGINAVTVIERPTRIYTLSLAHHHTYLVGQHAVVVHNFAETATIATFVLGAAEGGRLLSTFLAANPIVAPVTISVTVAGLAGYTLWSFIKGSLDSQRSSKKNNDKQGNAPQGPNTPGTAGGAAAFLKSLDDNKENAIEVFNRTCEWLKTSKGIETVKHCFRQNCEHHFGRLFARFGVNINDTSPEGKKRVIEVGTQILIDVSKKLIDMGSKLPVDVRNVFENVVIEYGRETITAQGFVDGEIIKVSTMFIQSQHVM